MRGRRKLACAGLALALVAVAGCGEASSQLPRGAGPSERDAPVAGVIAGMRGFTGAFGALTATEGENSVFSPAGIAYAFAMLRAGAAGETARQLDEVFGFPGSGVHVAMRQFRQDVVPTDAPKAPTVAIANGLFVQQGLSLGKDFVATLSRQYGAGPQQVDFAGGTAKETIDSWVAEHTAGKIKELFGELDQATIAVLANAVYFKGAWAHPFSEDTTRDASFRLADGGSVTVSMMSLDPAELNYVAGDGWQAVELPYTGGELAMWVLVPDEADAPPPTLTAKTLAALADAEPKPVQLAMPRWDFGSTVPLLPALRRLGLTSLADLPGIAPGAYVDDAIHRATVTVDEHGTEAAAATGIAVRTSMVTPEVSIRADHPFSFAVVHTPTGAPLFAGSVADPTQG